MDTKNTANNGQNSESKDSLVLVVGNKTYTVKQVYIGERTVQEVIGDFLERKILNGYSS